MISTVIRGASIIDGSGRPRFKTDLALCGPIIARIGDCEDVEAPQRIDAGGAILAPGFVDPYPLLDQSDRSLPSWHSKLAQGITAEIVPGEEPRRTVITLRDYGRELEAALDEVIERAHRTAQPLHISHFHAEGRANWNTIERALEQIDRARSRGADITCDTYPYVATWIELRELLPPAIDPATLDDENVAAAAALEMDARLGDIWHDVMLAEVASEERVAWCGMRFDEIARQMRLRPSRAAIEFVRNDGSDARAFYFCLNEDGVATVLSAGFCAVGTAAPAFGFHEQRFGLVHPRAFGTFPRVIGRFVRQRRTLSLEEAIHRMSGLVARAFGLNGEGELRVGERADLVLFDEREFVDTATYAQPVSAPLGLKHVWVAGEMKGI